MATMATALTHLGYDLWTLQTEPVNERGKHLEDKEELGLCLDYGLQVATDTPVVGQHRENTLIPSDCCHLSQENTGHTHYVRCVCVCSYVRMYILLCLGIPNLCQVARWPSINTATVTYSLNLPQTASNEQVRNLTKHSGSFKLSHQQL